MALGISPLFLLGNRMLTGICMGKPKIVKASGSKAITWQLTTNSTPLQDMVGAALNDIQENISANSNQCEPGWFRPGQFVFNSISSGQ